MFDQQAVGGQGAAVDRLIKGLNEMGYAAEPVTDLHPLALAPYDVIYLCDMHEPGKVADGWRDALTTFVTRGGGVLQTWHHHRFGEVGRGVQRIYGRRQMRIVPGHPAVEGVPDFKASYSDHIVERVGPAGIVILQNDAGQPVACAGKLGQGKVISTGLALAIPGGRNAVEPRGVERRLLERFLAWLAPETPRQARVAAMLNTPPDVRLASRSAHCSGL